MENIMKLKYLMAFLLMVSTPIFCFSQGNWELLIPSPTSNQMTGMYFIDDQTGWSVGEYGTILKSTDSGENWSIKEIPWLFDLSDVYFPTAQTGYAVGTDGFIIKSVDGGETWRELENKYSNNLNRVLFKDEETGWVIGEKGLILHTADGGTHWFQQISNSQGDLRGIDFVGTDSLCVVGEEETILIAGMINTVWSAVSFTGKSSLEAIYNFEDVYFVDAMHGWICGYNGSNPILLVTSTSGQQWKKRGIGGYKRTSWSGQGSGTSLSVPFQQVYFYDDLKTGLLLTNTGITGNGNIIHKTTDGGSNWKAFYEGSDPVFSAEGRFCVLSDDRVVMTGYQGSFRYSDDQGQTNRFWNHEYRWWDQLVAGKDGKLLATQMYLKYEPEFTFQSGTKPNLINHSYRSDDYGHSFQLYTPKFYDTTGAEFQPSHNPSYFNHDYADSYQNKGDTLWCVCSGPPGTNSMLYTVDFGQTHHAVWGRQQSSAYGCFLTPDTMMRFNLYHVRISANGFEYNAKFRSEYSTDKGMTFISNDTTDVWNNLIPASLFSHEVSKFIGDYYFFNGHTGFVVGSEGNIIKTTDMGHSWTNIYSGVVENLWDVEFLNPSTGFVVGDFGRILKTVDGGGTWYKTNSGTQEDIYSIGFMNEKEGWVGTENGLRCTKDGGETWQGVPLRYEHNTIENLVFFGNEGYAYTLSPNDDFCAYLLHITDGASGVSNHQESRQPDQITLSQNYPNPFNSETCIEYRLMNRGDVKLKIFNIRGELVRTLVDHPEESGSHSIVWDSCSDSGLPVSSGIYVYQLEYNGQVNQHKLLLLK